jgi:hypothetical protein
VRNRRIGTAFLVAGLAVVLLAVTHTITVSVLDRNPAWLEAGTGRSVFEWTATAILGLCALAAAVLALAEAKRRLLLVPLTVGLTVVFLADAMAFTEKVDAPGDAAVALAIASVFILLWLLAPDLAAGRAVVRTGLLLLALSVAIRAADPIISELDWEQGDLGYEAKVVVKHGAELAGWILVAFGIVPEALSRRSRAQSRVAAAETADSG